MNRLLDMPIWFYIAVLVILLLFVNPDSLDTTFAIGY